MCEQIGDTSKLEESTTKFSKYFQNIDFTKASYCPGETNELESEKYRRSQ